jgi:hypothetical protein
MDQRFCRVQPGEARRREPIACLLTANQQAQTHAAKVCWSVAAFCNDPRWQTPPDAPMRHVGLTVAYSQGGGGFIVADAPQHQTEAQFLL